MPKRLMPERNKLRWYTISELCDWLGVSRSTINKLRKQGLPYVDFDGLIRFDPLAVERWLRKHWKGNWE